MTGAMVAYSNERIQEQASSRAHLEAWNTHAHVSQQDNSQHEYFKNTFGCSSRYSQP